MPQSKSNAKVKPWVVRLAGVVGLSKGSSGQQAGASTDWVRAQVVPKAGPNAGPNAGPDGGQAPKLAQNRETAPAQRLADEKGKQNNTRLHNILDRAELAKLTEEVNAEIGKLPEGAARDEFAAAAATVAKLSFADPATLTGRDQLLVKAVKALTALRREIAKAAGPSASSATGKAAAPTPEARAAADLAANDRLDSLKLQPEMGVSQEAFEDKLVEANGTESAQARLDRANELEALLTHPDERVQLHTATLIDRGLSLGMADSEPLLIRFASTLAKAKQKPHLADDDNPDDPSDDVLKDLEGFAKELCDRLEKKGLFSRYVGEYRQGSAAVKMLQNGDAEAYYFWSLTEPAVESEINARQAMGEIVTRLESSAAAGLFDGLTFGLPWSSKYFRRIFKKISGPYAERALLQAKLAGNSGGTAPLIVTAVRGVNADSVLGTKEWPRLEARIQSENLPYEFRVYHWKGAPSAGSWQAPGFANPSYKSVMFNEREAVQTIRGIENLSQVPKWNFKDKDSLTVAGGPHVGSKRGDKAFACMPVAFLGEALVGLQNGLIHLIDPSNGEDLGCTGMDENDYAAASPQP